MNQLAGMVECYQLDIAKVLPEYPTELIEGELTYVDGVDDYTLFMNGWIDEPAQPDNPKYMEGWKYAESNWFSEGFMAA